MGIDYSAYLGPYFRCENPLVKSTKVVRVCSGGKTCSKFGFGFDARADPFCPSCGSQIIDKEKSCKKKLVDDTWAIIEATDEAIFTAGDSVGEFVPGVDLWVPNRRRGNSFDKRGTNLDTLQDMGEYQIAPRIIDHERHELSKSFAVELALLQKSYGKDRVSVCWGLLLTAG